MVNQRDHNEERLVSTKTNGPIKGFGPMWYACFFYQKCLNITDKSTFSIIRAFPRHGYLLEELNGTRINLILKRGNPTKINDYVLFMSKLLANRHRKILPKILSPLQSTFVQIEISMTIFLLHTSFFLIIIGKGKDLDIRP